MTVNFINSERVKINDKELMYLREPVLILKQTEEVLLKIGPDKFFSSPEEEIKKARESFVILYFLLAIQSKTTDFNFCLQPKEDPPDFGIMKIGDKIETLSLDWFELVEIPVICSSFQEMMKIIQKKIEKRYSVGYNLLIFVNSEQSNEWINLLNIELKDYGSFISIWTLNLLTSEGDYWPVVNRLRPLPLHIETKIGDIKLPNGVPASMEEHTHDGKKFLSFKPELLKELKMIHRNIRLAKDK